MKIFAISFALTSLFLSVISCHKAAVDPSPLWGKWSIINDSLLTAGIAGSNYIGSANDYYDFKDNGSLFIKKDSLQYSATYSVQPNNQINIVYSYSNIAAEMRTYDISNLTAHSVTLTLAGASMGPSQRQIINLKK